MRREVVADPVADLVVGDHAAPPAGEGGAGKSRAWTSGRASRSSLSASWSQEGWISSPSPSGSQADAGDPGGLLALVVGALCGGAGGEDTVHDAVDDRADGIGGRAPRRVVDRLDVIAEAFLARGVPVGRPQRLTLEVPEVCRGGEGVERKLEAAPAVPGLALRTGSASAGLVVGHHEAALGVGVDAVNGAAQVKLPAVAELEGHLGLLPGRRTPIPPRGG